MNGELLVFFCVLSGVLLLPAMLQVLRGDAFPGQEEAVCLLLCLMIWCLGYAGELAWRDPEAMRAWLRIQYLGIAFLPPWLLLFTLSFTGFLARLPRGVAPLCFALSSVTLVLNWTFPHHGLFYRLVETWPLGGLTLLRVEPGPVYVAHVLTFYTILILFFVLAVRHLWTKGPLYQRQILWLGMAVLIPTAGNVLYMTVTGPLNGFDPTCVLLSCTALLLLAGSLGHRLFDVVPFARDFLVERLGDGVVVADTRGRVVDLNPAASRLLGVTDRELGGPCARLFERKGDGRMPEDSMILHTAAREDAPEQWLEVRRIPLTVGERDAGLILVLRDVGAEQRLERERDALIAELREALANVKTLGGLIPICACCKKIRDDKGYWNKLEVYIQNHSDASFSHGLCPECLETYYEREGGPGEDDQSWKDTSPLSRRLK